MSKLQGYDAFFGSLRTNMDRRSNSQRRQLTRLGESTSQMLTFQDMLVVNEETGEAPPELARPALRMHRSMEYPPSGAKQQQRPRRHRKKTLSPLADIVVPPLDANDDPPPAPASTVFQRRGLAKSYSSPPLFLPRAEQNWHRAIVDVAPGYTVPLCGAEETRHAFRNDSVIHTECSCCNAFLYCIDDATMVLCPTCRSICPVEASFSTECLGIGLTVEQVMEEAGC